MLYRIYGDLDLWTWMDLKADIKGISKDYRVDEKKKIIYKEFEVTLGIEKKEQIESLYNVKIEEVV